MPLVIFFTVFFVIPVGLMFAASFDPSAVGQVALTSEFTLENYVRFFGRSNYLLAAGRSVALGVIVAAVALVAWRTRWPSSSPRPNIRGASRRC